MVHQHGQVMSRKFRAQRDVCCIKTAVSSQLRTRCRHVESSGALVLHAVMNQASTVFEYDLDYRIRETDAIVQPAVAFNKRRTAILLRHDQYTGKGGDVWLCFPRKPLCEK